MVTAHVNLELLDEIGLVSVWLNVRSILYLHGMKLAHPESDHKLKGIFQ